MQSVIETLENNQVKLVVVIPEADLLPKIEDAFVKVSRQARLPGFRQGKAPRKVLEAKLGVGFARSEAINESVNHWAESAIIENEIEPISSPVVKVVDGEEAGDVTIDVVVNVRPVVEIDGYRSLTINLPAAAATDTEIEDQLVRLQEALGTLEDSDAAVGPGSVVTLDLTIQQGEDEPVELSDYVFRIGAEDPYPGLTAALMGSSLGAQIEFESVSDESDNGSVSEQESDTSEAVTKSAVTHVSGVIKLHQSLVKPELNDDFAKEASEFDTLDELRADMRSNLDNFRSSVLRNSWRQALVNKLAELANLQELPESLVRMEFDRISHNFGHRIESSGLSFAKYLELANTTADEISMRIASDAVLESKYDLIMRAIARAENLEVSTEDLDQEVAKIATASKLDIDEARTSLASSGQLTALKAEISKKKALDWIFENINFVDEHGVVLDRAVITGETNSDTSGDIAESKEEPAETPDEPNPVVNATSTAELAD